MDQDLIALLRDVERAFGKPPARPVVVVDFKVTGGDPARHEIIEVGMIRSDGRTLETLAELELRVIPEHLETADPDALQMAGYSEAAWHGAVPVRQALAAVVAWIDGAVVGGHHVAFDLAFLDAGLRQIGAPPLCADYPRLDTVSLAWPLLSAGKVRSLTLGTIVEYLGIDRPYPHRALADARCSLAIARCLHERVRLAERIAALGGDELAIVDALIERMEMGRGQYGPWHVGDGRNYAREAYAEILDALN